LCRIATIRCYYSLTVFGHSLTVFCALH
jgi:hypothetical protein